MELLWDEVTARELLEADFFECYLKLYADESDDSPTEITPQVYYEHLYANPKDPSNYKRLLNRLKTSRYSQLIFIEGFAGCGKSTIVNRIFYDLTVDEKNRKYDYTDFNYKLGCSRYDYNDGANTCPESNDEIDSLIREGLASRIALSMSNFSRGDKIYGCFRYLAENSQILKIDKSRTLFQKLVKADVIIKAIEEFRSSKYQQTESLDIFESVVREQLIELTTSLLLATDFLWRMAQYIELREESFLYVAYDNLDAIDYPDVLENFDEELVSFVYNLNKYVDNIYPKLRQKYNLGKKPCFKIFATYRKITAARANLKKICIKHEVITENRYATSYISNIDVSNYFDYCSIVNRKIAFFEREARKKSIMPKVFGQLQIIKDLNNTKIIRSNYKSFWNDNFRGCANIMQEIVKSNRQCITKSIQLVKNHCDAEDREGNINVCVFTGASSIFLRIICDLFRNGNIFGGKCLNLIPLNASEALGYTTLSRLILSFYYSREKAPINELFAIFTGIYSPKDIAIELSHLLEKNEMWRRPLYYTEYALSNENLQEQLVLQAKHFSDGDVTFTRYTELKLCPCGELYIEMIVTSFEFFACRCLPNSKPIYCEVDYENIKCVVSEVIESVKNCCEKLVHFRNNFMKTQKLDIQEFLKLPFHSTTNNGNSQLHEERIIFNHISYLELFRRSKITGEMNENKIAINKLIVDKIIEYLELYYTYIANIDPQRKEVAKTLMDKAEAIKKTEYKDNMIMIQS